MTRSIFDPDGGQAERSGSRFTPPDAISNLPEEMTEPNTAKPEIPASEELKELAAEEEAHENEKAEEDTNN